METLAYIGLGVVSALLVAPLIFRFADRVSRGL